MVCLSLTEMTLYPAVERSDNCRKKTSAVPHTGGRHTNGLSSYHHFKAVRACDYILESNETVAYLLKGVDATSSTPGYCRLLQGPSIEEASAGS